MDILDWWTKNCCLITEVVVFGINHWFICFHFLQLIHNIWAIYSNDIVFWCVCVYTIREVGAIWHSEGKIDPTLKISNRLSWYLTGIRRLWQYMYSIMKCKHIWLYSWDIWKIKKYRIRPFCTDPGAKRHTLCHFAPNCMFHCINVV